MQNKKTTETLSPVVFDTKLEDVKGGVTVAIADLVQTTVKAGTPIGYDENGLYHVVKTAKMQESANSSATALKVLKGHNFKVDDYVTNALNKASYAITSIVTTEEDYDTINIGTTLGEALSEGDVIFEALEESASDSAFKYTPFGLVGTDFDVTTGDNHFTDCVVRGSVKESLIPPIHADIKYALYLIRFVPSIVIP